MTHERKPGTRCEICVFCGRCFEGDAGVDAVSGPTDWAGAFKALDDGSAGAAPPVPGAPGISADADGDDVSDAPDAVTGATPGVASACREFGLDDAACLMERLGIKPPGQA